LNRQWRKATESEDSSKGNSAERLIGGAGEVAPVMSAVMIDEIIPGYVGKAKGMLDFKFARDAL